MATVSTILQLALALLSAVNGNAAMTASERAQAVNIAQQAVNLANQVMSENGQYGQYPYNNCAYPATNCYNYNYNYCAYPYDTNCNYTNYNTGASTIFVYDSSNNEDYSLIAGDDYRVVLSPFDPNGGFTNLIAYNTSNGSQYNIGNSSTNKFYWTASIPRGTYELRAYQNGVFLASRRITVSN